MKSTYLKLALNNAWANATLWSVVRQLSRDAFTRPVEGAFPSLALTLSHILEVDRFYLDALEGGGLGRTVYETAPPTEPWALAEMQAQADQRLARFCDGISHDRLAGTVQIERPDGMTTEFVGDVLLHLFQHQIHHRGQAHCQLSRLGQKPPQLDEFFLVHDRAASAEAYWA